MSRYETEVTIDEPKYNPITVYTEHPLPSTDEGAVEYQKQSWDFPPEDVMDSDYLTADELYDRYITIEATADPWEIQEVGVGIGGKFLLWHTDREIGYVIPNREGQFWSFARIFHEDNWETTTQPTTIATEVTQGDHERISHPDDLPLIPYDNSPVTGSKEYVEERVENDPNVSPHHEFGVHVDLLHVSNKKTVGEFNDNQLCVYDLAEYRNYVSWWNTAGGYGMLIDLEQVEFEHLKSVFTNLFTDEQLAGDGSCPRCLSDDGYMKSYPHGRASVCNGCGFEIPL